MTNEDRGRLKSEIKEMKSELDQLEAALPPHGLKPGHLLRIEALEEAIEAKTKALARLDRHADIEE